MTGRLRRLEDRALAWLQRRRDERLMRRFGGIQRCPWCRQIAQHGDGWSFQAWDPCPALDVLTCGVCGGASLWHFGMGMHPMAPLMPPEPDRAFPDELQQLLPFATPPPRPGRTIRS